MSFEEQIRERAYHIWLAGGRADGRAEEHWTSAEQAVRGEIADKSAEPEVILTRAAPKAKAGAKATAAAKPAKAAATAKAPRARKAKPVEMTAAP